MPGTLSHCYKVCLIDAELSWFTNHRIHHTWIHVSTVSTKSNNFFDCTSCWQRMKQKWQLEKKYVISRQKTQQGITGSAAIWYKTDNIWHKNKQTREEKGEQLRITYIEYSQQLMVKLVFILVSCLLIFIKNACHTLVRFKTFLCACCSFYFYLKSWEQIHFGNTLHATVRYLVKMYLII